MRKKLSILGRGLVLAMGMGVFLTAVTAPPQPASAAYSDCGFGVFCTWNGTNGGGTRHDFPFSVYGSGTCWNLTVGMGNNAWSSAYQSYQNLYKPVVSLSSGCFTPEPNSNYIIHQGVQYHLEALDGGSGAYNNTISSFRVMLNP